MQFHITKRKIDAKIKASILICLFLSWSSFTLRHSMNSISIIILLISVFLIFILLHPYLLQLFSILRLRLWNPRLTNYEYIEFGENGLYFRYPDSDYRIDTNISEIKIEKKGYDYIYNFGNNKKFFIPTEKPSEWNGSDTFSFMFIAKTIAKNHSLKTHVQTSGSWKITDIKESIIGNFKNYNISYSEASLAFSKLSLDNQFLIIKSSDPKKSNIEINSRDLSYIYEVETPKTNYWLNILRLHDSYLIIKINKNWFICKI